MTSWITRFRSNWLLPAVLSTTAGAVDVVGFVDAKGVVQLRDVKVGRDFGAQSEILSGVSESDIVIVNPSDSLTSGTIVRVAATPSPAGKNEATKLVSKRRNTLLKTKN
jgi:hypothetical protein